MDIILNKKYLKAALTASFNLDENSDSLEFVILNFVGKENSNEVDTLHYVGTDKLTLFAAKEPMIVKIPPFRVVISSHIVDKVLCNCLGNENNLTLTIYENGHYKLGDVHFIEQKYLVNESLNRNYLNLVLDGNLNKPAFLNPELYEKICYAICDANSVEYSMSGFYLYQNGFKPSIIWNKDQPNIMGIVMPIDDSNKPLFAWEW